MRGVVKVQRPVEVNLGMLYIIARNHRLVLRTLARVVWGKHRNARFKVKSLTHRKSIDQVVKLKASCGRFGYYGHVEAWWSLRVAEAERPVRLWMPYRQLTYSQTTSRHSSLSTSPTSGDSYSTTFSIYTNNINSFRIPSDGHSRQRQITSQLQNPHF